MAHGVDVRGYRPVVYDFCADDRYLLTDHYILYLILYLIICLVFVSCYQLNACIILTKLL